MKTIENKTDKYSSKFDKFNKHNKSGKFKKAAVITLSLMLCIAAGVALAGCGSNNSSASAKYKVAIVQLADNDAFSEMSTAFKNEMDTLGYKEGTDIVYDMKSAGGDASTLNSICAEIANSDYSLIVPIVTPATQAVVNASPNCPVVFISVTDPVGAGIMTSMATPDKNATGTSNIIPIDEIFKLANTLTPNAKKVGLLYCSGEKNASITIEKAKTYLESNGYTYEEKAVANSSEVQQAAQSLAQSCEMIYIPVDSTVQSAMPQVVEAATAAGIPVYGSDPVMVSSGALASISVSNTQLGQGSAQMAHEILSGKSVSEVPAVALDKYQKVVSSKTASALGITLPTDGSLTPID